MYYRIFHASGVTDNRQLDDLTYHFSSKNNHELTDYRIIGIAKIFKEDKFRKTREQFWIKKLKTLKPHGLNTKAS